MFRARSSDPVSMPSRVVLPSLPSSIILPFRPSITTYRHRTQDRSIPFEWDPFLPRPLRRLVLLRLFGSGFLIPVSAFLRSCNRSSGAFELDRPLLQVNSLLNLSPSSCCYSWSGFERLRIGSSQLYSSDSLQTSSLCVVPHSTVFGQLLGFVLDFGVGLASLWLAARVFSHFWGAAHGLAILEATLINSQLWSSKGAPLLRFTPPSSFLINSQSFLRITTAGSTHPSYGGPVPRPSPVHPAANVPARRSGFVQRPLTPMPVTRNGKAKRFQPASCGFYASNPERAFPIGYDIKLVSIWGRPGPVLTANIRDPRLLMGNQTALRANSPIPTYFPRLLPSLIAPSAPRLLSRHLWSGLSSSGTRRRRKVPSLGIVAWTSIFHWSIVLVLQRPSLWANAAAFVPPAAPRPRHMSTPPSSPRGPPGYVPSPSAANWGRRRGSESSTVGQPSSRRSSTSAASLPESEEVVVYHSLSVDQIHMLLEQPEGVNPYDHHLFSNRVPKDKYRFTAVGFAKLCHAFPTTSQAERDARVAFFESLVYLRRPDAATVN
ncbi:hypothetical protein KEM48_006819 [Puccinia striiformis f. sp. tritici PST-130]|nr:hypothetical protein KEM48_006819 [Puccinia striiformis f. sp. tritici PST-130]